MPPSAIPLRYRLPNPPAVFVGRKAEGAALAGAVRRAPVSVVWGLGGSGKTALILHTLHTRFARRVDRTIFVPLRPGGSSPDVEVARALAETTRTRIDWAEVAGGGDAVVALALDLAESGGWWIVLEDLQHAAPDRVASLLPVFARYARRSRVVATSRFDPDIAGLHGQVLALGAMPEEELARLAQRAHGLTPAAARAAAGAARGSPWRLLQRAAEGGPAGAPEGELGLPARMVAFLRALAAVEVAIPREVIESFAPSPGESIDSLARRGLLERGAAGYRVHDVVRGLLPPAPRAEADGARAKAGAALAALDDPTAALEGIRLLAAAPGDGAATALDRCLDTLLAAGLAPRLWDILGHLEEPRFDAARLRCAVDLGWIEALARVRLPDDATPADRLEWARARRLQNDLAGAAETAAGVRAAAERAGDRALALEAALLRGRCRLVMGAASEVLDELAAVEPENGDEKARCEVLAAQALTYVGRAEEAVAAVRALRVELPKLGPSVRAEVGCHIARVLYDATLLGEASSVLDGVLETLGESAMARFHGRIALHMRMYIAQDRGRLDEARTLLRRLEPLARGNGYLRGSARSVEAVCRIAWGDFDGLDAMLGAWIEESGASGNRNYRDMAESLRWRLATIEGRRLQPRPPPEGQTPDPVIRWLLALHRIQNRLRHGDPVPRDAWPAPGELAIHVELRVLGRIVSAEASLLCGDPASAVADARTALEWARESGYRLAEEEALLALLDALLVAGRDGEAAALAGEAAVLAGSLPAPRLAFEAAFAQTIAEGAADLAVIEPYAPRFAAPAAARRGRALLSEPGAERALDALDRRVVDAIRSRPWWKPVETLPRAADADGGVPAGEEAAWGIDAVRRAVWLPDGRTVSFAKRHLLFQVLLALAASGGRATKEELVLGVWGEREYHRLRHDNRLHLAVLKCRRAIEDDPASPTRLLATEHGYALGGHTRLRRA